ncbi:uncharacterized protein LOC123195890 [Mangifera indica]|uniref:uncharacterized protein LOC123195890 n=1 Tax=Mangifera indica TaxID=29780 RepID=UPI001CFAA55D|nr:uncharacterized protein LOC123195890 [Mangifera indica]
MAQQKMHCAVQRTYIDNQKVIDGGKCYSFRKSLEHDNYRASSEDCEIASLKARNSGNRCSVLTFFTPESVGLWRIVAQTPECLDHVKAFGSGSEVNMDGLHLVTPSPINSLKVDQRKPQKGPLHDVTYFVKSFPARSFPGSDGGHQSQSRTFTNKATRLNEFSSNPCSQGSISCRSSSAFIPQRSSCLKSSDLFCEKSKVDKAIKRNLSKKTRKKGKQKKKFSRDSVSTELKVSPEDYDGGTSVSKTCSNNDMDHGDRLVSCATSQEDSLSDSRVNVIDIDNNNGIRNPSESPKTCTSYFDEIDMSEAKAPSSVQNFHGGCHVIDSEISIHMEDQGFPILGGVEESNHQQISHYGGIHSNGLPHMCDSRVLDSTSVGSNSDISSITSCNTKPCDKESNENGLSDPPEYGSREACFSCPNSLNGVVDFYDYTEGSRIGNQNFRSSDMQAVAPGKKSKQAKMVLRGSSAYKLGSAGKSHGCVGKENSHRVWQKVQKNKMSECCPDFKKVNPVGSETLKEASLVRKNPNVAKVDMSSKTEDKKHLKRKVLRKQKRKTCPGSKQEYNSYSPRASHHSKASSNAHPKISTQPNEILDISTQVSYQKRLGSVLRSHPQIGCQEVGFQNSRVKSLKSESLQKSHDCPEILGSPKSFCNTVSGIKEINQDNLLARSCCLEKLNMFEGQSQVYLPHLIVNEAAKEEKDISLAEYSKQNHCSGSLLQKWVPIGTKNPQSTTSTRCDSVSSGHSDGQGVEDWILRSNVNEKVCTKSQNPVCLLDVERMSTGLVSESTSQEDENYSPNLTDTSADIFKEKNSKHVAANCLTIESKDQNFSAVETDLEKILLAVNHACRMLFASEAVQMATGSPIAEFERLLHSSSPVIYHSPNIISCNKCSQDQVVGASLCRHEAPNILLGSLWKWYEKHGSYGLEIRAEDYEQSNRLGVDRFSFRAYFVPFLSAVQLFRNGKGHPTKDSNDLPTPGNLVAVETGETSQSSCNIGHLTIYSLLVPQPRTSDTSVLPPEKEEHKSEWSPVSSKEKLSVRSADMTCSNDPELLFEYFESEQPRQRQPFYEKIQELASGDGPSQWEAYGDPTSLNSINLQDLHPTSWYSVAWYPIYRIPDANFRAAFLTYHSLGHMIRRSTKVNSADVHSIVSPAVGLQSYNAQSECWFQLKHPTMNQAAENSGLNPSRILKDRLSTLEETACRMSRAVVNKGNQTSVNRHPDYEFFRSRQHR